MHKIKDDLKFNYEHPDIFYLSQWQSTNKVDGFFLSYKVILCLFYVFVFAILFYAGQHLPFFIRIKAACYYTFWIFFISAVSAFMSTISAGRQYCKQRQKIPDNPPAMSPAFYKTQWILQSIILDSSVAVTLGYFSLEFFYHRRPYGAGTSTMHLWNTLLILMDFFICSTPAKLVHIYPSLIVGLIYAIFTYVYYVSGGLGIYNYHYLYKMLDYKQKPLLACLAHCIVALYIVVGRIMVYLSHKLKRNLYYKYYSSNEAIEMTRHLPLEK